MAKAAKKTEQDLELEHQTRMRDAHILARNLAQEVFSLQKPSREIINGVYLIVADQVLDEDDEIVDNDIEACKVVMFAARTWALTVYGDDSPEATFDAYEAAFAPEDEDEDDEDYDD